MTTTSCANCKGAIWSTEVSFDSSDARDDVKAELALWTGPRCPTPDGECEDYDGAHPFHSNAIETFWTKKQTDYVHKSDYERALGLLDEARNGLQWYRTEYPDADSRADDEVFERIDRELTNLGATFMTAPMFHVYANETEWFSATSPEHAEQRAREFYGEARVGDYDTAAGPWEQLPDDKVLTIDVEDDGKRVARTCSEWANDPANKTGFVGTTEF